MTTAIDKRQFLVLVDPLTTLLNCSEMDMGDLELRHLAAANNFGGKVIEYLDGWSDALKMATFARLFRLRGSPEIKRILSTPPSDPVDDAKVKIRDAGRTPEDLVPLLSLPPGQAHRTAALTYQSRNLKEGKCCNCPEPRAQNSVRYCERHLAACRDRARSRRSKKLNEQAHGCDPGDSRRRWLNLGKDKGKK